MKAGPAHVLTLQGAHAGQPVRENCKKFARFPRLLKFFYLRFERRWSGAQFIVRQSSACCGVFAFAHLVWHSSFTPQMALGKHSLQVHLVEPTFTSQYKYAFASLIIHASVMNASTEAKVMAFM
jgi:hypothetical protein